MKSSPNLAVFFGTGVYITKLEFNKVRALSPKHIIFS